MTNKILEEINIQDYNIITAVRKVKKNETFPIYYRKTIRVKCISNTLPFILQAENKNYLINDRDFLLLKDENNNVILSTYNNDNIESDFFNDYKGPIYDIFKNADIKFQTKKIYCKALKYACSKYNLIKLDGLDELPDLNDLFNDNEIRFPQKKIIYTSVLSYIKHKTNENPDIDSFTDYLNDGMLLYKRNKKLIDVFKKNEFNDIKKKLASLENENVDVV